MADQMDDETRPPVRPVMGSFNKGVFLLLCVTAIIVVAGILYFVVGGRHVGLPGSNPQTQQQVKPGTP